MNKTTYFLATMFVAIANFLYHVAYGQAPVFNIDSPGLAVEQVVDHMRSQIPPGDTGEGGAQTKLGRFQSFWTARVGQNDSPATSSMFDKYFDAAFTDLATKQTGGGCTGGSSQYNGNWRCIGPNNYPNEQHMAYIQSVWADPNDATAQTVLAGTYGGLFKTTNGGASWQCLTDASPNPHALTNIQSIAVHPQDPQVIYLGTYNHWFDINGPAFGNVGFKYGAAILRSTNNGASWSQEAIPSSGSTVTPSDYRKPIQKVVFSPDGSRVYALKENRIFFRSYTGTTWTDITPSTNIFIWGDIKFRPGTSNDFTVSSVGYDPGGGQLARIFRYTFNGSTHSTPVEITAGMNLSPPTTGTNLTASHLEELDMAYRDANRLLVIVKRNTVLTGWGSLAEIGLIQYDVSTGTWNSIRNLGDIFSGCGGGCFGIETNTANPDIFYLQGQVPKMTIDGGVTLRNIGWYNGHPTHGDIRNIFVHTSSSGSQGTNDVVVFATDGGVSVKKNGDNPWTLFNNATTNISQYGPMAHQFYSIATSEDGNLKLAGSHHNGLHSHEPGLTPAWKMIGGGDAWNTYFERINRKQGVGQDTCLLPPSSISKAAPTSMQGRTSAFTVAT